MKTTLLFSLLAVLVISARAEDTQGLILSFRSVSVSSPVPHGVVAKVRIEEGDTVQEGQVLVQLRSEKEGIAVQQAQKRVENAEFEAQGLEALAKEKMGSPEKATEAHALLDLLKQKLWMDRRSPTAASRHV